MGFSKEVRESALVHAARHCCVCHRYTGVNVEVHHIVPRSDGGSDDIDNAIALCFDCHASAGHYNPEHPKGSAYAPGELRKAKECWHSLVRSGVASSPPTSPDWAPYCRYIICKNFEVISEVVRGDFSRIPVSEPLLTKNVALEQMRMLVQMHDSDRRGNRVFGDMYSDVAAYRTKFPGVRTCDELANPHLPYFETVRIPDEKEIRERVVPSDPVSGYLLDEGARPEDVCLAIGYEEDCGGGGFQELYKTRPLWAAFLEIRNIHEAALTLHAIEGELSVAKPRYWKLSERRGVSCSRPLPAAPILQHQSVIVPLAAILGPLLRDTPSPHTSEEYSLDHAHYQKIERVDYSDLVTELGVIGPAVWPSSVLAESQCASLTQEIHALDLSNLYTIDRYWAMGSCPHLFFRFSDGRIQYIQEIFSRRPVAKQHHHILIPDNVDGVILAELEHETTHVCCMSINGQQRIVDRQLKRGEFLEESVVAGDDIHIVGWYCPELFGRQDTVFQNQLIWHFIEDMALLQ